VKRAKRIRYITIKEAGGATEADLDLIDVDDPSIATGLGSADTSQAARKKKFLLERREFSGGQLKQMMVLHQKMQKELFEKQREANERQAKEERAFESARQDRRARDMTELVSAVVAPLVGLCDKFISPVAKAKPTSDSDDDSGIVTWEQRAEQKKAALKRAKSRRLQKKRKSLGEKRAYLTMEDTESDDSAQLPRETFAEYVAAKDGKGGSKSRSPKERKGARSPKERKGAVASPKPQRRESYNCGSDVESMHSVRKRNATQNRRRKAEYRAFKKVQLMKNKSIRDVLRACLASREPDVLEEIKRRQEDALAGPNSDYEWHSDMDVEEQEKCMDTVAKKVRKEQKRHSLAD
jgi:hypothetical protein